MLGRRIISKTNVLKQFTRAASTPSPSTNKGVPAAPPPEGAVAPQAPNYPSIWSSNQRQRPAAASGPRFEQTNMELQPNPLSAMEMIANEPVRIIHGRKAVCDGGAFSVTSFLWTVISHLHPYPPYPYFSGLV
ncbi:hypothetical protein V5O48_000434 [Marasmius crinis-equi]|uniref:Uncharacterized protein n=1 Tax=Marasmius crinis-equi TaxID=585013 RepID=A0ABR3G2D3_9AGAR